MTFCACFVAVCHRVGRATVVTCKAHLAIVAPFRIFVFVPRYVVHGTGFYALAAFYASAGLRMERLWRHEVAHEKRIKARCLKPFEASGGYIVAAPSAFYSGCYSLDAFRSFGKLGAFHLLGVDIESRQQHISVRHSNRERGAWVPTAVSDKLSPHQVSLPNIVAAGAHHVVLPSRRGLSGCQCRNRAAYYSRDSPCVDRKHPYDSVFGKRLRRDAGSSDFGYLFIKHFP